MPDRADPVPPEVRTELTRVVQRWRQLPLDHALSGMPRTRDLLARLDPGGSGPPDLGPSVVMDQLTVLVYDACCHGDPALLDELPWLLSRLRLALV